MCSPVVEKVLAGNSCKECGRYRFDPSEPSYLYLLTHPTLKLHQVGIGTIGKDKGRLDKLLKEGWLAFGIWHGDQRTTFLCEKKVFAQIKKIVSDKDSQGADPMGKWVDTWSESISADAISASEIEKIISKIVKN
jgi:hypothetical protein